MIGATFQGKLTSPRYFDVRNDFVIPAKTVKIEQVWSNYATSANPSITITVPTPPANSVIVCILDWGGATYSAPLTYGGVSWTGGLQKVQSGYNSSVMYWYKNPTAGNVTISGGFGSSNAWRMIVYLLSGVNQTTVVQGGGATAGSTSAATSGSVLVPCVSNGLIFDAISCFVYAPLNGQTTDIVNGIVTSGHLDSPGDTSQSMGYSFASSSWAMCAGCFIPA